MERNMVKELMFSMQHQFVMLDNGMKIIYSKDNGYFQMETTMKDSLKITNLMVKVHGILKMETKFLVNTINILSQMKIVNFK
jgi:hypothetical protein